MRSLTAIVLLFLTFTGYAIDQNIANLIRENPDSVCRAAKLALKKTADPLEKASHYHII